MTRRPAAFVTGASRGIGRGIAIELARSGFDIAGGATSYDPGNRKKGLAETEERINELGASFLPVAGDIAELDRHEAMLSSIVERFGRLDLLVNNAGIGPKVRRDILETEPDDFDRVLGVNMRAPFFLAQRAARLMLRQEKLETDSQPAMVFISSISADTSSPSRAEYCISKAGLSHAAAIFAHRLASEGIQVFDVRPGITKTDMTAKVTEKYDALIAEGGVPQGRWAMPVDVGRAVAALARGDFAFSTGLVVEVSGGMNIRRL